MPDLLSSTKSLGGWSPSSPPVVLRNIKAVKRKGSGSYGLAS